MTLDRKSSFSLALVVIAFVATCLGYDAFPEQVPTHWNVHGVADQFAGKAVGVFVLPVALAVVWSLFFFVPRISPRGFEVTPSRGFGMMQLATIGFLFAVWLVTSLSTLGTDVSVGRAIEGGLGLLFVVLGNFMGTLKKNFFVGIRTPWTLSNDEVWARTHRLGGKLFVVGGVIMTVSAFALPQYFIGAVTVAGMLGGVVPMLYSLWVSKKLERSSTTEAAKS